MEERSDEETKRPRDPDPAPEIIPRRRVIAVTGQTADIASAFWTAFLARALSEWGKKVLILDIGSDAKQLSSVLSFPNIHSSLKDLMGQREEAITVESPPGLRAFTFQGQWGELKKLRRVEREVLFRLLKWEEDQADVLLINLDALDVGVDGLSFLKGLSDLVLWVVPDAMLHAYRLLKILYHAQPDLNVGLIQYDRDNTTDSTEIHHLISASTLFLKKSPMFLGRISPCLEAFRSKSASIPLLHPTGLRFSLEDIAPISRKIVHDFGDLGRDRLFFELIETELAIHP